ncbi:hypothetical protein [Desulfoluna sp.]|uniref:hypothetical protein n=1 Tax=Desulfoluna sp. TaxID=2045199 RepID=UPI00262186E9|nr:hypothetical protein [Desulfoluna sp.]
MIIFSTVTKTALETTHLAPVDPPFIMENQQGLGDDSTSVGHPPPSAFHHLKRTSMNSKKALAYATIFGIILI